MAHYDEELAKLPEEDRSLVENEKMSQRNQNQDIVDEVQAVSRHWLYNMKYLIAELKRDETLNTANLQCRQCNYKNFR